MSNHDQEHPEIGRRLRETGLVSAPDDLADNVMREVRAEPRPRRLHRREPLRRRALTFALAAAVLAAAVLGISRLQFGAGSGSVPLGGGTRIPEARTQATHGSSTNGPAADAATPYRQFTLGGDALRRLTGSGAHPFLFGVPLVPANGGFELYAPPGRYARVAAALARAAAEFSASGTADSRQVRVRLYHLHR